MLAAERFAGGVAEVEEIVGDVVRQIDVLSPAPDGLDRVEVSFAASEGAVAR